MQPPSPAAPAQPGRDWASRPAAGRRHWAGGAGPAKAAAFLFISPVFSDRFRTVNCCGRAVWRLLNAAWCRGRGLGAALSGAGLVRQRDRLLLCKHGCLGGARRAALGQGPCWRLGSHRAAGQHVGCQRAGRAGAMDWRPSSPGAYRKYEAVSRSPGVCLLCGSRTGGAGQREGCSAGRGSELCPAPGQAGRAAGGRRCPCSALQGPCPGPAPRG